MKIVNNASTGRPIAFIPTAVVLSAIAIGILLPSLQLSTNPSVFIPMIFIAMVLGPQVIRWSTGHADTFSLTAWACGLLLLGYTLLPLIQLRTDRWFLPHLGDVDVSLYHASWVALIGLIAFVVGIKMPFVEDLARRLPVATYLSPQHIMLAALIYLGLGFVMNVYLFKRHGGLDTYLFDPRSAGMALGEGYLSLGLELSAIAVFLAALLWMLPRSRTVTPSSRTVLIQGVWPLFLVAILTFLGSTLFLRLSRSFILSQFLGLAIMYHYLVRPLRFRSLAILAVAATIFASVLGLVRQPGIYNKLETFTPAAMWERRDWLTEEIFDYAPTTMLADPGRVEMLMGALERVQEPTEQLLWGKTYVAAFLQVIPRVIWPDKWLTSAGEFQDLMRGKGFHRAYGYFSGSWATGMMVEGYLNFYWPGVILASFFAGIGLAVCERYRTINSAVPSVILIYAIIFPRLFRLPLADFGMFLVNFGRLMVPLLLVLRFASRPPRA